MHLRMNFFYFSFLVFFSIFLSQCSSSQQGEEQLETSQYEDEEQGQYDEQGEQGYYDEDGEGNEEGNPYGNEALGEEGEGEGGNSYELDGNLNEDSYGFDDAQADLDVNQGGNNLNYPADDLGASFENEDTGGGVGGGAEIPSYGDGERVVRYVLEDGVNVYREADANSEVITNLFKGHPLVVVEMGEWSQIASDRYVRSESLSAKLVPRHMQPAEWNAP